MAARMADNHRLKGRAHHDNGVGANGRMVHRVAVENGKVACRDALGGGSSDNEYGIKHQHEDIWTKKHGNQ